MFPDTPELPDELDLQLIKLLTRNVRYTNKELAARTNIAEITVANRLRRLSERGIARIVGILDAHLIGYDFNAILFIETAGRLSLDIAKDLATIKEVRGVSVVSGKYDVVASITTKDLVELRQFIETKFGLISGIKNVEYDLILDVIGYSEEWAKLSTWQR